MVGNPVAHSQSPFIHAAFARADRRAGRATSALLCPLDGFAADACARSPPAARSGCNVTMPFKFEAFELAARTTPRARARRRLQHAALRRRRLARRQHRRRRPGARHRAQRRRRAARRARAADRRRRRRGRRARRAARGRRRARSSSPTGRVERARGAGRAARAPRRATAARRASRRRRSTTAASASTSSSTPARAASPARRCRSRRASCGPARLALDMMYGPAADAVRRAGPRRARRARPRRPRHARRAGGRGVRVLARRRAARPRRCCARCAPRLDAGMSASRGRSLRRFALLLARLRCSRCSSISSPGSR